MNDADKIAELEADYATAQRFIEFAGLNDLSARIADLEARLAAVRAENRAENQTVELMHKALTVAEREVDEARERLGKIAMALAKFIRRSPLSSQQVMEIVNISELTDEGRGDVSKDG